ncbi:MAG TPA: Rv3654c family TadE-like protein [Actinomycetota bacterium]|nr:Rv3654c family TadE-like protein [Actinomycetota bacterium]
MREHGSVSLIVAATLAFGAVFAAFSSDLSRVAVARARAQSAADAAALAAAQQLIRPSDRTPTELAAEYAERGDAELVACRCDPRSTEAVVTVERDVTLLLLGQVRTVQASARAVVAAPPGTEGLQPFFVARLSCLFDRVDGLWIVSGFRTRAEQAALYEVKPGLAAPPGHSNHELGLAADLGYPTPESEDAAHAAAPGCGLTFPMSYEPWHVEPMGLP